jgi:hypothetical protein
MEGGPEVVTTLLEATHTEYLVLGDEVGVRQPRWGRSAARAKAALFVAVQGHGFHLMADVEVA